MNYDLARLSEHCELWMLPVNEPVHEPYTKCGVTLRGVQDVVDDPAIWTHLLKRLDYLVFVERPCLKKPERLFQLLRKTKTRVVCIPNWEGFPSQGWGKEPDIIWCTSRFTHEFLREMAGRDTGYRWQSALYGDRWGVDASQFHRQGGQKCERFLFVNGHGGQQSRKGLDTLIRLLTKYPQLPFVVRSTVPVPKLPGNDVRVIHSTTDDRAALYSEGDVFVSLSHWEGLGLQGLEAMASNLPALVPDYAPVNEHPALHYLQGDVTKNVRLRVREVPFWEADIDSLARTLRGMLGTPISLERVGAYELATNPRADLRLTVQEFERVLLEQA